jgi:hypothetical protein
VFLMQGDLDTEHYQRHFAARNVISHSSVTELLLSVVFFRQTQKPISRLNKFRLMCMCVCVGGGGSCTKYNDGSGLNFPFVLFQLFISTSAFSPVSYLFGPFRITGQSGPEPYISQTNSHDYFYLLPSRSNSLK